MWREYLRIASKVLRANKFRSSLTMLSITIGALSIVFMSSLAGSGLATLSRKVEELGGARWIALFPSEMIKGERKANSYTRGLTREDLDRLGEIPHLSGHMIFARMRRKDVFTETAQARADLVAADAAFTGIYGIPLERGRLFTDEEDRRRARVCLIGHSLSDKLWDGESLGKWLTIGGVRCQVVGQLVSEERNNMNFGIDPKDLVVVPLGAMLDVDANATRRATIILKTDGTASNEIVVRIANQLLTDRHHGVDDFEFLDFAKMMKKWANIFVIMQTIVGFLAGIALLVGGVGVMNMMLVSVSERVREIGIRKALGASPRDIGRQFILEAMVLSGSGGMIGVILGGIVAFGSGLIIQHFMNSWVNQLAYGAAITAMTVSIGVGLIFGYFPAQRAAKLDAIVAMRR